MMQNEKIEFRKARDFGGIINDTFAFARQNIAMLFKSLLFIVGPLVLMQGIMAGLYGVRSASLLTAKAMQNPFDAIFGIEYMLLLVFALLSYTMITIITLEFVVLYAERGPEGITMDVIWKSTKKDFWMMLLTFIGNFFVIIFSMLLLIIPGIYFSIVMSLVPIIRIQERTGYFASVRRSMRLISGSWWFTLGLFIILALIVGIMGSVMGIPSMAVNFLSILHGADVTGKFYKTLFIITGIVQQLSAFFSAIVLIASGFLYYSLVEKKEGAGLLKKVEEIGTTKAE
jgi:hypothetical protein